MGPVALGAVGGLLIQLLSLAELGQSPEKQETGFQRFYLLGCLT